MHITVAKFLYGGSSSVIYQDVTIGTGQKSIDKGDTIKIRYAGYLVKEGKVDSQFDSNYEKDKPFSFQVGAGKVVKGMDDGVIGMKKKKVVELLLCHRNLLMVIKKSLVFQSNLL